MTKGAPAHINQVDLKNCLELLRMTSVVVVDGHYECVERDRKSDDKECLKRLVKMLKGLNCGARDAGVPGSMCESR